MDLTFQRPGGSLAGWTVLAGRNGSGKTTLLRAIALALSGPTRAQQIMPSASQWISFNRPSGTAEAQIAIDPDVDRPKTGRLPKAGLMWAGVEWELPEGSDRSLAAQSGVTTADYNGRNPSNIRRAAWNASWNEQPVGWFCAGYGPFRRLTGEGSEGQRMSLGPLPLARITTLFREDASLAESVRWLQHNQLRAFEGRTGAEELVTTVLRLLNDGLLPDGFEVTKVDSEGLWVTRDDYSAPLEELSDGYRTVAALVIDLVRNIFEGSAGHPLLPTWNLLREEDGHPTICWPGVVLIDEVETHLHVSWQQRIGPWLCQHFPDIQFIVTTHSPYVCQTADPGGLIRLPGPNDPEGPRPLDDDEYKRVVHGSGDDALLSDLFGVETVFSLETLAMRAELTALEARVIAGDADSEDLERYEQLQLDLASSPLARVQELRHTAS